MAKRGIKQILLMAPAPAHPLLKQAVALMTRDNDPLEPRAALRRAGGANEPDSGTASADLVAVHARLAAIEQQRWALAADRDAARAAEAAALEAARLAVAEGHRTAQIAQEAQDRAETAHQRAEKARERVTEALQRAEKAEAAIQQAKSLPGLKGRLVRFLAGDVLK